MSGFRPVRIMPLKAVLAQWDAIVIRWDLSTRERSSLLGGAREGPVADVATYDAPDAEHRMRLVLELEMVVNRAFGDEEMGRRWLRTPNANFSRRTPLEVVAESSEWLEWLVTDLGRSV